MNMMFSGPTNENWSEFHSKYGNGPDRDRRSMMQSTLSAMGSSCRSLIDSGSNHATKRDSDGSMARSPPPQRGVLPRAASARVLMVQGNKAGVARSSSGSLLALRGALVGTSRQKSQSLLGGTGSSHGHGAPQKPRRSRSPMPDKRRSKSPMRQRADLLEQQQS
ncbi:expressed unknown protein [Seminavis robusta]|uniref:Uncharacterized protein n=1 Tax=Seminavis robusta TaxID=568900 RepID=A0A9N8ENF1_9STRA|nr:expressed unknown protein [Seminavis robusta]|eukprot:Sro1467_g275100.1 n/a (164) ;mRNA; f:2815-3306